MNNFVGLGRSSPSVLCNLSSLSLSTNTLGLFEHTTTFVPTPNFHFVLSSFVEDVNLFIDRLKVAFFRWHSFSRLLKDDSPLSRFYTMMLKRFPSIPKSISDDVLPTHLKQLCSDIRLQAAQFVQNHRSTILADNLTPTERFLLQNLASDTNLVIKPADKGRTWVLLNRADYVQEANRQLQQPCYSLLNCSSSLETFNSQFVVLLSSLQRVIPKRFFRFVSPPTTTSSRTFYLLPKIHKDITDWPTVTMPPGRPIISDCGSESEGCAALLDAFLQPLAKKVSSYLRDTDHLIAILSEFPIGNNCFLVSLDVSSLYTNIDNEAGLLAISKAFQDFPDSTRPDNLLLPLLRLLIESNTFLFNGSTYQQGSGVSMGKRFSPSYANLYMASWEKEVLQRSLVKPLLFKRFIDDIFIIWPNDLCSLHEFIDICNSVHQSIKVVSTISMFSIHFLDICIYKGDHFSATGLLDFKIAFKSTDSHRLLSRSSFHPPHVKRSVIWSQVMRFARRCSSKSQFDAACNTCFSVWSTQGYSFRSLRTTKYKVLNAMGYYRNDCHWPRGFVRCRRPICIYCDSFCKFSTSVHDQDVTCLYRIFEHITCNSRHVIYAIWCVQCSRVVYVGETANVFSLRIANHLSTIRRSRPVAVALHFNAPNHSIEHVRFIGLQSLEHHRNLTPIALRNKRRAAETVWIRKLGTLSPIGVNDKSDLTPLRRVPFVTTYTPQAASFINGVKSSVEQVCGLQVLPSYKNSRNLRSILCSSRLPVINS